MAVMRWIAILLLVAALAYFAVQQIWLADGSATTTATIGGQSFSLQIAADPVSLAQGLMGVRKIAADEGMVFVFPRPSSKPFWMKNCVIDIDIIFLDGQGRVVDLHEMKMEPPRRDDESERDYENRLSPYGGDRLAQFAIELKAGTIRRLALERGEVVQMELRRLKRLVR